MTNQCLETVRKEFRAELSAKERRILMHARFILLKRRQDLDTRESIILDTWIQNFERLGKAYQLKESFYDIWESQDKEEALTRYEEWLGELREDLQGAFHPFVTACTNWQEEIFTYFSHPLTNSLDKQKHSCIYTKNKLISFFIILNNKKKRDFKRKKMILINFKLFLRFLAPFRL